MKTSYVSYRTSNGNCGLVAAWWRRTCIDFTRLIIRDKQEVFLWACSWCQNLILSLTWNSSFFVLSIWLTEFDATVIKRIFENIKYLVFLPLQIECPPFIFGVFHDNVWLIGKRTFHAYSTHIELHTYFYLVKYNFISTIFKKTKALTFYPHFPPKNVKFPHMV